MQRFCAEGSKPFENVYELFVTYKQSVCHQRWNKQHPIDQTDAKQNIVFGLEFELILYLFRHR